MTRYSRHSSDNMPGTNPRMWSNVLAAVKLRKLGSDKHAMLASGCLGLDVKVKVAHARSHVRIVVAAFV